MPDPAQGPPQQDLYSPEEFAGVLRKMHPELAKEPDDHALTSAVLKLYPEFRDHVQDPATASTYPVDKTSPVTPPPQVSIGNAQHIGADPGGRPFITRPSEFGFEAGAARLKRGLVNAGNMLLHPSQISNPFDAATRAAADVVGGGMQAGEPLVLPAAALAPLPTAAAVAGGTITTETVKKGLEYLHAPPALTELVSDIAGLVAGGKTGHAMEGPAQPFAPPRSIPAEERFQTNVQGQAIKSAEAMGDRQNLQQVEATLAKNRQAAAEADAQLKATAKQRVIGRIAVDAAGAMHKNGMAGAGPFAYLDTLGKLQNGLAQVGEAPPELPSFDTIESFRNQPPVLEQQAAPAQLPEQAGPSTATPQNFIIGAPPELPIEAVGERAPRVAQATPEHLFESQQLSDRIDRMQEGADKDAALALQEEYKQAHQQAAHDNASELEHHTYDREGQTVETVDGNEISRAVGGSTVYNRIVEPVVGKNPKSQPPRSLITALVRAYAETGAKSAAELPQDYQPQGVRFDRLPEDEQRFFTSKAFRNQYNRYIEHIVDAADSRAKSRMASQGPPAAGSLSPEDLFSIGRGPEAERGSGGLVSRGPEIVGNEAGPPPVEFSQPARDVSELVSSTLAGQAPPTPPALVDQGKMPPGWLDLPEPATVGQPTATFLGYSDPRMSESGQPEPMYNISGGPSDRSTVTGTKALESAGIEVPQTPDFEAWKANRGAPPAVPQTPPRRPLLDLLNKEEGHLILNVRPGDLEGLRRWYHKQEGDYGGEDWYQAGISALAAGDPDSAWRVASIAAARSYAAAIGGAAQRNKLLEPIPGVSADQLKTSIESQLGEKLPKGTTIGEGGIVKLPGNPGGLDPKFTDLVLGKQFVGDLVDMIDPSTIVRVENEEGKLPADIPKELRISYQMADQILRQMPDDLLEPFLDDTGLDRAGAAAHLARAASQAGKTLATFKHWQDAHWDEILHLNPELAGTRGPGAAGRLEFLPEERQAQILSYLDQLKAKGAATPEMRAALKDLGFELPKTIKPESKEALTYTRRWLTKQRRLAEMGKTLDIAAASGDDFDRVAAASALGLGNERSTAGQIFDDVFGRARLSFMLSQTSTAMKILESHGLRYNLGTLEEVFSGVAARLTGKEDHATEHFQLAREMSSLKPGTFPTGLARKPWTDSLGEMFNYTMESVTGLEENDRRRALATLDSFPREEARMTGAALLGEQASPASKIPGVKWLVDPRVRNVLTVGIRAQAAAIRSALYDGTLRSMIVAKGDDPADILGATNPGQALIAKYGDQEAQAMVGSGVAAALNYTYAGRPLPDSLPGKVIDTMSSLPVISTMLRMEWAFPRFQFATVPRWVWDRMPGSIVFDLMAKKFAGVGRLAKGAEKSALQDGLMPTQIAELNRARYDSAKALQDSMASRLTAREAAQALKGHEKAISEGGLLPEVLESMHQASQTLQEHVQTATQAAKDHRAAEARVSDLTAQLKSSQSRLTQLQEVDAPTWEQALARQATGVGVLMPLALAMRNSKGAEDTEYYEYKVGGKPLDMRPFLAGFGPFLLYADFFSDVAKHTDWSAIAKAHEDGATSWSDAFAQGYTGKYTDRALLADTTEAWLTIHPLFGTASWLMDALSGKQAEGEGSMLHQALDEFLSTTGQAIGSFFLPAQTMSDLVGAVVPSEATSRTPERPGQYTGTGAELAEPAASHLPGVREQLPERISPFTGEARTLEHPALHQLLGTTFGPEATEVQREITNTGLKPGLALPRVSGDAEFDNKVNKAYAQVLRENFGDLLRDADYQKLPPAHRRDVLEEVFKQLKAAAYGQVAEEVGAESAQQHLRPDRMAKVQRWEKLAQRWAAEGQPPATVESADESGAPPQPPAFAGQGPPPAP